MMYAKPLLSRVDLKVEHCMCCTLKDWLTGQCRPQMTTIDIVTT